ncbi:WD40-repeat-containing domain protein [Chytridium lagenaria]|nr:WD40-repeat-containing domain protein [Chytridium lagenaria]
MTAPTATQGGSTQPLQLDPTRVMQGHTNAVSALCVTGGRLYSASKDFTVKEWDLHTGECLRTFVGHTRWVRAICPGAGRLFTGSWDDTVREWDLESGECVRVFEGAHDLGINAVVVDEELQRLYSGSDDRTIAVYDLTTGETVDTWAGYGSGSISSLAIVKMDAGGFLVSGASDGSVCLWDLSTGHCLESLAASTHEITSITCVGSKLYAAGNDKAIHEWDLSSFSSPNAPTTFTETRVLRGHSGYVSSLVGTLGSDPRFPPGGPRLFSGSWDGTVRVWDGNGASVCAVAAHDKSVNALELASVSGTRPVAAFGEDGNGETEEEAGEVRHVLFTGSGDGTIKAWDLGLFL